MARHRLVRGLQAVVLITVITFAYLIFDAIRNEQVDLAAGLSNIHIGWIAVAAVCALQEGVCGGLRIWVLGRVLWPPLRARTGIMSEFVLMFCAGATPGQVGAAPGQFAVLLNSGMKFADVATAELLVASCTVIFFLTSAIVVYLLRENGLLVVHGAEALDVLVVLSLIGFGSVLCVIALAAAYPPLLHRGAHAVGPRLEALFRYFRGVVHRVSRGRWFKSVVTEHQGPGKPRLTRRMVTGIDEIHRGFRTFMRRGKLAYLAAIALTFVFFCTRFAVAYFLLLGLGIDTEPRTFVSAGPPIVQVLLVQALLNFALYLSPTPSASGVAEAGSSALMDPWVYGPVALPFLVLWRLLAMFLCMFVGGVYVFRFLGTDVLDKGAKQQRDAVDAAGDAPQS